MADFKMKRGDQSPTIKYQLLDDQGDPVDITGFQEVRFLMRPKTESTLTVDADTNSGVTVTDAANGVVQYEWASGDTDTPGSFEAEWEVTFSGGDKETFPNHDFIDIYITADLG
jgi:hypothetical protein